MTVFATAPQGKVSMTSAERTYWGKGKVEFLAVEPEIRQLLGSGMSKKAVFQQLVGSGKLSCSYRTFCWATSRFLSIRRREFAAESTAPSQSETPKKEVTPNVEQQKPVQKPVVKETPPTKNQSFGSFSMGSYTDVI